MPSRGHAGNPAATNLLDDMSDDALTGFGLRTDGLGARSSRLWGFQKSWWSNSGTLLNSYVDSTQDLVLENE